MSNNVYGIDLGTNNFKVYSKATGKTMLEKNTIAVIDKNQIYAYGDSAYAMYEKAPETINVIFPVVEGVIADYNLLQTMIFDFLEHKTKARIKNAEFIIAVPTDITDVEKRAFYELFYKSKSKPKKVMLCEKPIADAVGLGIDVNEPTGVMIVDMGADTTETSVISLGGKSILERTDFINRTKCNISFIKNITDTTYIHNSNINTYSQFTLCSLAKNICHQVRQRRLRTIRFELTGRMSDYWSHQTIYFSPIRLQNSPCSLILLFVINTGNGYSSSFYRY